MLKTPTTPTFAELQRDPARFFASPGEVLSEPGLSPEQRLSILESWEADAREMEVAEEENMAGGEACELAAIRHAIRQLVGDQVTAPAPSKQGPSAHPVPEDGPPRIAALMSPAPMGIDMGVSAREAAREMADHDLGMLFVIDDLRRPVGVITDRDLVIRCLADDRLAADTPVSEVMTREIVCIDRDAEIQEAASLMQAERVRRIAVTDEAGTLVGVFGLADLAKAPGGRGLSGDLLNCLTFPTGTEKAGLTG